MKKQTKEVRYIPESNSWMIDGHIISEDSLTVEEIVELREICEGTAQVMYGNRLDERKSQQIL